jgi:YHS domain-containing protein
MKPAARFFALALMVCFSAVALAAPIAFTAPQQESVNKISAKGGLVMQLANDSDLLVVNLSLGGKTTTDAELAEVKNLPKVAQLNLANTAITDAGLSAISGLTELTTLHLEKTAVTDAGLANLKGLSKLEYLNLYATGITDAGLANLDGLKNLKKLYLWQTKVTDAGVAALKKSVPGVIVNRGEELAVVIKTPEVKPDDKKPEVKKPEVKPAVKAPEAKPAVKAPEAKPAEAKPVDKKPEAKPADAKPADPKPQAAVGVVNTKCPVSDHAIEAGFTAVVDGKTVGFCCDKCLAKFNKDPKSFAGKIVADAK